MDLLERIRLGPVLGDGAMGTMLQARGLKAGSSPDLANLDRPDLVTQIHSAYREAGADYLETNTFGANSLKLAAHGLSSRLPDIVARGIDLARSASGDTCMVAGSVGPTGLLLEPYGDTPHAKVYDSFAEVGALMDKAGIDFFLVETMTDVSEASIAISAIKAVSSKPVVATAVFSKGARGYRTIMGTSPGEAALKMTEAGAELVGTNCCSGIDEAIGIMKDMVSVSHAGTITQPNAGLPTLREGCLVYPEDPARMAEGVPDLIRLGVCAIGGCCGTTPAHIRAIAQVLGRF
ncbi:MAG: homocysteine S-methyltransferase family protein [Candidatus Eisenbacteria bacterium]